MKTKALAAGLAATAMVVLAACSSGSTPSAASRANSTAAVAEDAALHAALPSELKSAGVLKVATDATVGAPFATFASDNTTITGLDVDLANALGQVLGVKVQFVNVPFDGLIPGLEGGRYDVSVSTMLDTKKREAAVDFVDFMKDGSGFLVRGDYSGAPVTLQSLCGKSVGVLRGSFEESTIEAQNAKCAPQIGIKVFQDKNTAYLALDNGRIDVFADALAQINYNAASSNGKFKAGGEPFGVALIGMGVAKNSPLVSVLQQALQKLIDDGQYKAIMTKNKIDASGIDKATINDAQL